MKYKVLYIDANTGELKEVIDIEDDIPIEEVYEIYEHNLFATIVLTEESFQKLCEE